MGAALFTAASVYGFEGQNDPARMAAQFVRATIACVRMHAGLPARSRS
jgi:uncharacterized membrane protein YhiD involved in acid resistance